MHPLFGYTITNNIHVSRCINLNDLVLIHQVQVSFDYLPFGFCNLFFCILGLLLRLRLQMQALESRNPSPCPLVLEVCAVAACP